MTTTTTYTIPKVRKKSANQPIYGLDVISFMLPFSYFMKDHIVVAIRGNTKNNSEDRLLTLNTHYTIDGSLLTLDEESLNLEASDSLDIILNITRNTVLDLSVFKAGHPITAYDLNHNFSQLVYLAEENETLIRKNTYVSDTAPLYPYKGQTWLRTPYYVHYIFDGTSWVQPS